eukprot:gene16100-biopygen5442
MRPHLQRPDVTDAELIQQLNLAGAEESERNAKLGIGQKGKAKVAQVSLEQNTKGKAESPKKDKEAETPLAQKLLSEIQAIKAEVASLKQDELSDKFERVEHGSGDSEDHRVFVSHLTPQGQEKLSKLVGRKCLIKCSMNGIELPVLFDTGAQVSIVSSKELRKHFPQSEIKDIADLLDQDIELELSTANGSKLPYSGWVKMNFKLLNSNVDAVEVPMLVTEFELEQPIIGYNVIEELIKSQQQVPDETNLISLLSASFFQTSQSDLNAFVSFVDSKSTPIFSTVRTGKKSIIVPKGSTVKISCRSKVGLISRPTPMLFEPDNELSFPSGLEVHESLLTLKRENCDKVGIYVINTSAHDITLKGRTEMGFLQPVRSVTPVELKFKDHNEMDKDGNPKELKSTKNTGPVKDS